MNVHGSKQILFNKSTLLSLKAELLKKQEEVQDKKHLPKHNVNNFKLPNRSVDKNSMSDDKTDKKTFKDSLKAVDVEELEACRKAKAALEKKAELYKHLSDGSGNSELAGRFLVDFKGKKSETVSKLSEVTNEEGEKFESISKTRNLSKKNEGIEESYDNDEDEWVEFTDFLGRTRKCLKSDLEHYKRRDAELRKMVTNERKEEVPDERESPEKVEKPILVQKTNDYLQSLREKWEEKERELLAKDRDIHYQDLLFDEARIHGVGYYAFSTEETERKKQMEELIRQRQETLKAQEKAEEVRKRRDELVAARVAAARARQRARQGLPAEDPNQKKKDFTTCLLELLTKQRDEADKKAKEEEQKVKEEKEKERQKFREAYIREWDVGKEGVEGKVKKFRKMTQEEYVEQQRTKRIDEFAPFKVADSSKSKYVFDEEGNKVNKEVDNNKNKTWSDVRHIEAPPPPIIEDISDETQKGLYFTSKKHEITVKYNNHFVKSHEQTSINNQYIVAQEFQNVKPPTRKAETIVKYKNFVNTQEQTPINNELSEEEEEDEEISNVKPQKRKGGEEYAKIEPPPTYDYYGPTPKQIRSDKPFSSDLREAMAQGNKSLERKDTGRKLPQHYDFTFD